MTGCNGGWIMKSPGHCVYAGWAPSPTGERRFVVHIYRCRGGRHWGAVVAVGRVAATDENAPSATEAYRTALVTCAGRYDKSPSIAAFFAEAYRLDVEAPFDSPEPSNGWTKTVYAWEMRPWIMGIEHLVSLRRGVNTGAWLCVMRGTRETRAETPRGALIEAAGEFTDPPMRHAAIEWAATCPLPEGLS
jgi:hypothetical protein